MAIFREVTNLVRSYQRSDKNLKKVNKEMAKRGILTNGDYKRNGKFGNNSFKVCQKLKKNDQRGMLTVGDVYKKDKFGENSEFGKK